MSPAAFEKDDKGSEVWTKIEICGVEEEPMSIDLRVGGVKLEVSTCFLTNGVWNVGSVYGASALNHLLSTAIGVGSTLWPPQSP